MAAAVAVTVGLALVAAGVMAVDRVAAPALAVNARPVGRHLDAAGGGRHL